MKLIRWFSDLDICTKANKIRQNGIANLNRVIFTMDTDFSLETSKRFCRWYLTAPSTYEEYLKIMCC